MYTTPEQRAEDLKIEMAGIYETGGHMSFEICKKTFDTGAERVYTYPVTAFGDNDAVKTGMLRDWFGGSVSRKWNIANQWKKKGNDVPDLLFPMAQHAPSRELYFLGFELWQMTDDPEERVRLAREVQSLNNTHNFPSVGTYKDLIANPRFLAGSYFARGSIRESSKAYRVGVPRILFNTLNKPLLEAIKTEYGGHLALNSAGGFTLDIDNGETTRLVHTIAPALIYQDPAMIPYLN